jgi:hypothetical protein
MIIHRHVHILFYDDKTPIIMITRTNTENKYPLNSLTFSSKERLERLFEEQGDAYISLHSQLVFWDMIRIK